MTYRILHPSTGKVVNLYSTNPKAPVANGTRLSLYQWENNNDQKWDMQSVDGKTLLRLLRDTAKVLNRNSKNNNAHVWAYANDVATKNDSLVATETENGKIRIKLVAHNLYLTKNATDNYLVWAKKANSEQQFFELEKISAPSAPNPSVPGSGGGAWKLQLPMERYTKIFRGFTLEKGKEHYGIDYDAPVGTKVKAADAGIIVYQQGSSKYTKDSGWWTMGNAMFIHHPGKGMTLYMHMLDDPEKTNRLGASVTRGQTIGAVGITGKTTGPHLHFGLRVGSGTLSSSKDPNVGYNKFGTWADPAKYL